MARPQVDIEPFGCRVVVERVTEDVEDDHVLSSVTDDGGNEVTIYRPTTAANPNKEHVGVVRAVGAECKYAKPGDQVLFVRHLGEATLLDTNLLVMHENDILGRVTDTAVVRCA